MVSLVSIQALYGFAVKNKSLRFREDIARAYNALTNSDFELEATAEPRIFTRAQRNLRAMSQMNPMAITSVQI
jgi:hypothetical protein